MEAFFAGIGIFGILSLLVALLLPVIAFIDLYRRRKGSTGKTLLWILIILCIPYLGSILYFLFGRN
ncbi:MAG: hypothetical protein ACJAV5_000476 [Vicingaceae bacterium]|jgi:hypothetical protein